MKKNYFAPTMKVVPIRMRSQILAGSLKTNAELEYDGATPNGFNEDDMR